MLWILGARGHSELIPSSTERTKIRYWDTSKVVHNWKHKERKVSLSPPCDFEFPYYLQMIWFNQAENQSGGLIDILQDHWKTKVIVISPSLSLLSIDPIATSQNSRSLDWISHDRIPIVLFFFIGYFFSSQRGSDIVTPLNSDGSVDINIINKTDSTNLSFELMVGQSQK